jgi:hypothetical protein
MTMWVGGVDRGHAGCRSLVGLTPATTSTVARRSVSYLRVRLVWLLATNAWKLPADSSLLATIVVWALPITVTGTSSWSGGQRREHAARLGSPQRDAGVLPGDVALDPAAGVQRLGVGDRARSTGDPVGEAVLEERANLSLDHLAELVGNDRTLRNKLGRAPLFGLMSKYGWTLWPSSPTPDFDRLLQHVQRAD